LPDFERSLRSVELVRRIEQREVTLGEYKRLLVNLRQQVIDGGRWIARAACSMSAELFSLRSAFILHAAEEHRDYQMLEEDYLAVGGSREEIEGAPKNLGSEALSAFIFHQASQPDAIDLLGAMFVIEDLGGAKALRWAELLQAHLGLDDDQLRFLCYHGANDDDHFELLRQFLRSPIVDRSAAARIVKTAKVVARLYALQLEEIDHARARPPRAGPGQPVDLGGPAYGPDAPVRPAGDRAARPGPAALDPPLPAAPGERFIVETNLLNVIADNSGHGGDIPRVELLPTRLAELGDGAVIQHDLNVYNLVIDLGEQERTTLLRPRVPAELNLSALEVPTIDPEPATRRFLNLDIETALCCMNIPFALCLTADEYRRAVHSLQLDETLLGCLAELTGDVTFRTWRPEGFTVQPRTVRDVLRAVYAHAAICEYAHARLREIRDRQRAASAGSRVRLRTGAPPMARIVDSAGGGLPEGASRSRDSGTATTSRRLWSW
jgi:hypothetical protein